ncbi:sugar transferase [Leptothoe sp. ISB3NOV94-8A]
MTGYTLPLYSLAPNTLHKSPNATNILEKKSVVPLNRYNVNLVAIYDLKWRQNILWVSLSDSIEWYKNVPVQLIVSRLERSSARYVCIDPSVGEKHLKTWAEACLKTGKPLYLRASNKPTNTAVVTPWNSMFRDSLECLTAFIGVITISPLLLLISCLRRTSASGPIVYRQWRVGHQGKLYSVWNFCMVATNLEAFHPTVMSYQKESHKQDNDLHIPAEVLAI